MPEAFELYLSGDRSREFLYAHRRPKCERCGRPTEFSNICEECAERLYEVKTERQLAEYDEHRFD